jgi:hypothetical protein
MITPASSSLVGSFINVPQTGTSAPVQVGSVWYPGTASGLATAPSATPAGTAYTSGGSIADGTYYCKVTYVNRNGETTGSPTKTLTISGGSGSGALNCGPNDFDWVTGTYGSRAYFSNDNAAFYLQTPSVSVSDFMLDSTTHYVKLGSGVRKMFQSLTFSGTMIPTSNTATISPQQVALNATRRQSDYNPQGTLFLGALDAAGSNGHSISTPLIMHKGDRITGSGAQNGTVNMQTRLFNTSNWNDTKLAVVMVFGGDANISNMGIQAQNTNALMILGGAGYQSGTGYGMSVSDVMLRAPTNATYNPVVMVGILYHTFWRNISTLGGGAAVEWRNAAGQNHTFEKGRWDTSGPSYMKSVPGWTDPDNGAHDAAFPFGVANILLDSILFENGTGITWDCVGLSMEFRNIQNADAAIAGGTDSLAKFGRDAVYGGATNITLYNTSFGTSNNARVGTNLVGSPGFLWAYGNSSFGWGNSTATQITLDFNNLTANVYDHVGASGSWDTSAAATTPHVINVGADSLVDVTGDRGGGANVQPWNEIYGPIGLSRKSGSNPIRSDMKFIGNVGGGFNILGADRSTSQFGLNPNISGASDSFATFRGSARINAAGAGTNQIFLGTTTQTPSAGAGNVNLPSQQLINWYNAAGNAYLGGWRSSASDEMESTIVNGIMPLANATPFGKAGKVWNGVFGTASATGVITSTLATGTAPFSIASTTPIATMVVAKHSLIQFCGTAAACSATAQTGAQTVYGSVALSSGTPSTATITGISPAFTSSSTYICTVTAQSGAATALLSVANVSGSSFTITGPATDTRVVNYQCTGN